MSRTLQWVVGISVVVVSLAIVLTLAVPWISSWFGWGNGYGMMGPYGMMGGGYGPTGGGYGMMDGGFGTTGGGYGMMGGNGMMGGSGMMPWSGSQGALGSGARLVLDQARTLAEEYAAASGADFAVAEVMEFNNNFYAVVEETSTGRGAFEILIDPYTGAVGREPGPDMMWNDKYGHMSFGSGGENQLSMVEAQAKAQEAIQAQIPGATVHEAGASFYGYYTFDFDGPDGKIGGMISIEGDTGAAWLPTRHGAFISEWESEEAPS